MSEVIIIGGGLAGLFTALKLAPMPTIVVTPRPLGEGASSAWAQGGVAAAIGEGDSPEKHAADTIAAGAGLADEAVARAVAAEAPARIEDLLRYGVPFDRDLEGRLKLSREAAHGERRIVRVNGDQAGRAIMAALVEAVRRTPSIAVMENAAALELNLLDGAVNGVWCAHGDGLKPFLIPARAVILATGGVGQLYKVTTNPPEARGEGLAMAARAGAVIADAEFVQFHPTALDVGLSPAPLATEALRGEGATLVNRRGERIMQGRHPQMELAPRDIVARAVEAEVVSGRGAFLDCRGGLGERMARDFPAVHAACAKVGLNPERDLIPVAPAAHYHMGGVATDLNGRTTVAGLWAVGETGCTGLHGANRLASNSLLEAVAIGARAAADVGAVEPPAWSADARRAEAPPALRRTRAAHGYETLREADIKRYMSECAGVSRSGLGLALLIDKLTQRGGASAAELRRGAMPVAALLIAVAAHARTRSVGGHFRLDAPPAAEMEKPRRSFWTLDAAVDYASTLVNGEAKRAAV